MLPTQQVTDSSRLHKRGIQQNSTPPRKNLTTVRNNLRFFCDLDEQAKV